MSEYISLIELSIISFAAIIALRGLRENTRLRRVEVLGKVFDFYSSREVRDARKAIREKKFSSDFKELSKDQLFQVEQVLLSLSQVGIFMRLKNFNRKEKEVLFNTYGDSILSVGSYLIEYIEIFRKKTRREGSWYNVDFLISQVEDWYDDRK